jgi:membrane protease YdiL (CAAX protease family)
MPYKVYPNEPTPAPSLAPASQALRSGVARLSTPQVLIVIVISIVIFLALILVGFIASGLMELSGMNGEAAFTVVFVALMAAQPLVFVGTAYLLAIRRWGLRWADFGLRKMAWRWALLVPLLWILSTPVIAGVKWVIDQARGTPESLPYAETFAALGPITPGLAIAIVVLAGIVVPISEEFLFRGLLYPWLRSRWGVLSAALVSAAVFALLHVQLAVMAPIFVLGVVLALLREYSGSLWAPILYHGIQNTVTTLALFAFLASGDKTLAI